MAISYDQPQHNRLPPKIPDQYTPIRAQVSTGHSNCGQLEAAGLGWFLQSAPLRHLSQ
ncbi:hypothetical protein EMPG_15900 [Blastomyces silverae]|uniref:Uncharacterized protein n=1 Tax=Blastomyces silverae TaxID=2060906 RepID=A0A0H1BHJ8_9EURO|nr:hypothetical protein EMPG_15900 [Blastomyces silverae]